MSCSALPRPALPRQKTAKLSRAVRDASIVEEALPTLAAGTGPWQKQLSAHQRKAEIKKVCGRERPPVSLFLARMDALS